MAGYLALIVTTLLLTAGFAMAIASADIEEIKANWNKRRCEVPVVIASGMFKPSGDSRSSTEFAQDNFKYCVEQLAGEVIKIAFSPLYGILGQQMNVQATMSAPMNSIRAMIAEGMKTFSSLLDKQYRQYKSVFVHVTKTWHHIRFAMGRIQAIVTAIVYLGLSASALVQNTMKLIINIILIFIGIMIAMILLIWFGIIPFIGIIVTVIAILATADVQTNGWVFGGGGDAGAFCVDPDAVVHMLDGSKKPLRHIRPGDILKGKNNIVTGVLEVDSTTETLVSIYGVIMSNSHRVLYKNSWILAGHHPAAKLSLQPLNRLICLNTSEHSVPIESSEGILNVGDWEEISTDSARKEWIDWVSKTLNKDILPIKYPSTVPLVSPVLEVITPHKTVNIDTVKIGDIILSQNGYTKVLGFYTGIFPGQSKNPDWISDGVWKFSHDLWRPFSNGVKESTGRLYGIQLITEDGTFYVQTNDIPHLIRDFTEVGRDKISQSYSWLDEAINKKV